MQLFQIFHSNYMETTQPFSISFTCLKKNSIIIFYLIKIHHYNWGKPMLVDLHKSVTRRNIQPLKNLPLSAMRSTEEQVPEVWNSLVLDFCNKEG